MPTKPTTPLVQPSSLPGSMMNLPILQALAEIRPLKCAHKLPARKVERMHAPMPTGVTRRNLVQAATCLRMKGGQPLFKLCALTFLGFDLPSIFRLAPRKCQNDSRDRSGDEYEAG